MKVLLPTKNPVKIEKWGTLIKKLGYELATLNDLKETYEEPKEDGKTALENALKKAEFYYKKTGLVTITTDSSLYIDGLNEEEQIGLFAGREIKYDDNHNIISEKKLSDDENFERFNNIINKLGGHAKGYFEESIVIYYGSNHYEQATFKMDRAFRTPPSEVRKPNAPMRSFVYYEDINKYRSELDNDTANKYDEEAFKKQEQFFKDSLYKIENIMEYNFNILTSRMKDANVNFSSDCFEDTLKKINEPCICIGTGGSYCVSLFTSKVLAKKNNIIAVNHEPRDILYLNNLKQFRNLLATTYSNNNFGISASLEIAKLNELKTYILTNNSRVKDNYHKLIYYKTNIENEYSFISIASTFMPMTVMLKYYLGASDLEINNLIDEIDNNILKEWIIPEVRNANVFEIMSGDNTYVAAHLLESTIVEAGLGIPVIHEKYGYCHGRTTSAFYDRNNIMIYLCNGDLNELDMKIIYEVNTNPPLYKDVILLRSNDYGDSIVGEFDLAMKAMYFVKTIADEKDMDLSKVNYAPQVKKFYRYKGEM